MEFRFDLSSLLKANIVRITSNLIPEGLTGDRRSVLDAVTKISQIIDDMGDASARAQGLNKPVTTAQKLRNSDHIIYLLTEKTGQNGCVTGLLKIGTKNLYVFDANGETRAVPAPCLLDFYIHESRQRAGLGRALFEHMLDRENLQPQKMAIDRPSEKLLAFYRTHYGLHRTIPQMNNFVIYEGFFDKPQTQNGTTPVNDEPTLHITASPNAALFGPQFKSDDYVKRVAQQKTASHLNAVQGAPMGRFGAKRPTCSMAEIIHSTPTSITNEPHSEIFQYNESENHRKQKHNLDNTPYVNEHMEDGGSIDMDKNRKQKHNLDNLPFVNEHLTGSINMDKNRKQKHNLDNTPYVDEHLEDGGSIDMDKNRKLKHNLDNTPYVNEHPNDGEQPLNIDYDKSVEEIIANIENVNMNESEALLQTHVFGTNTEPSKQVTFLDNNIVDVDGLNPKPTRFQHNKQHTGLKNISFNVGAAVSPTDKMEFDQEAPESFGIVKINRPIGNAPVHTDTTDAMSTVSSTEGFTEQGYFDLKFYHNRLW